MASQLQAGAAQVNLTPRLGAHLAGHFTDRQATNIHDELWAKAIVLDNGERRLGIVICDLIVVPTEMADRVKERVAAEADLAPENVLVSGTHTHFGPALMSAFLTPKEEGYAEWAAERAAEALVLAARRLQPAELGWGTGSCETEVFNRRFKMRDGSVRMNPGPLNPDIVEEAGPADPTLTVAILRTVERRPLAVFANLALHYVGGPGEDISSDYFGAFARSLQRCAGAEFTAIMSNACFGDINNINVYRRRTRVPEPYYNVERVGNVAAGEAWKVWNTLWEEDFHGEVELGGALEWIDFAPRRPTPEQVAESKAYLASHTLEEDIHAYGYANEQVLMESWPESIRLPIQALRLGELGVVGLPGEVFCEIGQGIQSRSPFGHTCFVGLANGFGGYIAPDHQIDWGGYEVTLARHACCPKGTAQLWSDTAVRLLDGLYGVPAEQ